VIRTRTVVTTLTALTVLALGACSGDDPKPKVAPPSSSAPTSPSTSAASGDVAPTMPEGATAPDRTGAERFVEYWFEALSYAMVTGDTALVDEGSAPACDSCAALGKQIAKLYEHGGRVETDGWAVEASTVNGEFESEAPSFLLRVNQAKRSLYEGKKLIDRTPLMKVPMHVELARSASGWLVSRLEILG
jgi:Family of unknown function (DUF6318)